MPRKCLSIIAATLPLLCGLGQRYAIAQTNHSWTAPLRVQIGSHNFNLSFGINPNATAGFDTGIDIMTAPPPPATPYAYLALAVFPNYLQADRRGPSNSIIWNLNIPNTSGAASTVSWDVSQVPASVIALSLVSSNETVNMLQTAAKNYVGDQNLQVILSLAPLVVNAGNDVSICFGASTATGLNGSASGGSESYTFLWNVQTGPNTSSAQFNDPTLEDPTFTPTLAGTYVLRFTVNDGASPAVFDEVNITVNALPAASISGDDPVVTGTTHTYSANTNAASPSYNWSVSGGTINGGNTGSAINVTAGGVGTMVVSVHVTDGVTTCGNSATKNVTVNPNTLMANAGVDASICIGTSTNLNGSASGGSGSYTFLWNVQSGPNTSSAQFNNSALEDPTFTPTLVGAYVLRFTVGDGVVAPIFDEVTITVNPLPTVSVSGDDPVGAGTTHTYSANTNASAPSYSWSVNNGTMNGSNTGSAVSITAGSAGPMIVSVNVTDGITGCNNNGSKNVTVTSGCAFTADAGTDRSVLFALTTTLGGNPTAIGGTAPYTYSWSPGPNLDNPAAANPKATVTGTTTYTVNITDVNGCTATDQVIVTVQSFTLLSHGDLKIVQNRNSKGDLHANGKITFQPGAPGTHTGNLFAKSDITIQTKNTIEGNATSRNSIVLFGTATITGLRQDHANVETVPLPTYSFTAGGANLTVPANQSRTLAPGSYGTVFVDDKGKLKLSAGDYYFNTLDTDPAAILIINAAAGPVNIYVVNKLVFDNSVEVQIAGGTSDKILFVTLQSAKIIVGVKAILYGTLIAPNAEVQFLTESAIKGAVYASAITVDPWAKIFHHTSPGNFPKDSEVEESEVAKSEVAGYELAQNYPNPFWSEATSRFAGNPSTQIKFIVREAGTVQLSIYNLHGQEIRTLISGPMDSGNHAVNWDGKDNQGHTAPSGIYLCRLRVNGFEQTRKMTFMK